MSALRNKADISPSCRNVRFWHRPFSWDCEAAKNTPDSVINTLNRALQNCRKPLMLRSRLAAYQHFLPTGALQKRRAPLLHSEIERWGQVIRDNNIHIEQ
jgi:hypothetical protein